MDSPKRWITAVGLALVLAGIQAALLWGYAGAGILPALADGIVSIGALAALACFAWFVVGFVSLPQTDVMIGVSAMLLWLCGCFVSRELMMQITSISYIPFSITIPFRLLFGVPAWISVMLWYRLQVQQNLVIQEDETPLERVQSERTPSMELSEEESLDRITVKDGTRITLITINELLYIQACGDYVTLVTPAGQYVKEQTMKYFESHLPEDTFVRIHRSTIVNVTQISRVELFGKETYQLLLKNGVKLRVSLSGYKLLKERLKL